MIIARSCLLIGLLGSAGGLVASPRADLFSSSQNIRDAAASILLTNYAPTPRIQWESLVDTIKIGTTKTNLFDQLRPFNPDLRSEWGFATGGECVESYRLDDVWLLECHFLCRSNTLIEIGLRESLRYIWVEPPPKFTGIWTTYYVNGRKSHEIHYKEGKYDGEFTSFRADGSKLVVQHYVAHIAEGDDTGFFPSGRTMYRGTYRAGVQVGTWKWYNEDGSVRETQEHAKQ